MSVELEQIHFSVPFDKSRDTMTTEELIENCLNQMDGAGILFKIPYQGALSKIGVSIGGVKAEASDTNSASDFVVFTSGNDETLDEMFKVTYDGIVELEGSINRTIKQTNVTSGDANDLSIIGSNTASSGDVDGGNVILTPGEQYGKGVVGAIKLTGAVTHSVKIVDDGDLSGNNYYVEVGDYTILIDCDTYLGSTGNVNVIDGDGGSRADHQVDGRILIIKDITGVCDSGNRIIFNPQDVNVDDTWGVGISSDFGSVTVMWSDTDSQWHVISSFGTVTLL